MLLNTIMSFAVFFLGGFLVGVSLFNAKQDRWERSGLFGGGLLLMMVSTVIYVQVFFGLEAS